MPCVAAQTSIKGGLDGRAFAQGDITEKAQEPVPHALQFRALEPRCTLAGDTHVVEPPGDKLFLGGVACRRGRSTADTLSSRGICLHITNGYMRRIDGARAPTTLSLRHSQ